MPILIKNETNIKYESLIHTSYQSQLLNSLKLQYQIPSHTQKSLKSCKQQYSLILQP